MKDQEPTSAISYVATFIFTFFIVAILLASTFDFTGCTKVNMPGNKVENATK